MAALGELPYSADERNDIQLAVAECVQNIVRHAYAGKAGGPVVVMLEQSEVLKMRFEDRGPVRLDWKPNIVPLEQNQTAGGRGLALIDRLTVEFDYQPTERSTVTTLGFALPKETA